VALKVLAERHRDLGRQIQALTDRIDPIVTAANPALRAAIGVGPQVAAQLLIIAGLNPDRLTSEASFAALCGVAPVPASSGKTRHCRRGYSPETARCRTGTTCDQRGRPKGSP
jgi:transposase